MPQGTPTRKKKKIERRKRRSVGVRLEKGGREKKKGCRAGRKKKENTMRTAHLQRRGHSAEKKKTRGRGKTASSQLLQNAKDTIQVSQHDKNSGKSIPPQSKRARTKEDEFRS